MSALFIGVLGIAGVVCFGCLAHCVFKLYRTPSWLYEFFIAQLSYSNAQYAYLGACIAGLYALVYGGTRSLLFIIPSTWGSIGESGEFYPLIEMVAALTGFCSLSMINVVHRYLILDSQHRTSQENAITSHSKPTPKDGAV